LQFISFNADPDPHGTLPLFRVFLSPSTQITGQHIQ